MRRQILFIRMAGLFMFSMSFIVLIESQNFEAPTVEKTPPKKQTVERKTASSPPAVKATSNRTKKLGAIEACKEFSDECPYSDDDPRSFSLEKDDHLSKEIASMVETANEKEREYIVNEYLDHDSPYVQIQALEHLSRMPASSQWLKPLESAFSQTTSPMMIHLAAIEMARHLESPRDMESAFSSLVQLIVSGPLNVAQAAAENIEPFINRRNRSRLEQALERLPSFSQRYQTVIEALNRYDLKQERGESIN